MMHGQENIKLYTSLEHKDWDCLVTMKGCKKQEWSKQYTAGNPFQEGLQEDQRQRHAGRVMLEEVCRSQMCQIGRPLSRIEEDGRNLLRRPKLCIKSCRDIIIIIIIRMPVAVLMLSMKFCN